MFAGSHNVDLPHVLNVEVVVSGYHVVRVLGQSQKNFVPMFPALASPSSIFITNRSNHYQRSVERFKEFTYRHWMHAQERVDVLEFFAIGRVELIDYLFREWVPKV